MTRTDALDIARRTLSNGGQVHLVDATPHGDLAFDAAAQEVGVTAVCKAPNVPFAWRQVEQSTHGLADLVILETPALIAVVFTKTQAMQGSYKHVARPPVLDVLVGEANQLLVTSAQNEELDTNAAVDLITKLSKL